MKTRMIFAIAFSLIISASFAQLRTVKNEAFQRGEYLKYKAYYDALLTGEVIAGTCTFKVKDENKKIKDRDTYHMEVIGKTKGAFNWFFKVYDRYETYVDEQTLAPWLFMRRVDEGGYIINQDITFNQQKNMAYFVDNHRPRTNNMSTPEYVHDILSAIYYARTVDISKMDENGEFKVQFMLDDTVYSTKVIYLGKETIKTSFGKVRCMKIKPQVLTGTVFKDPYPVTIWVTDDKNKIPIIGESSILVGKVKMELIEYAGLKNPFTSLVK
ncbi:MAG TPA: DUF3108 domain-containing protein [Bacteroidales bacterium]|nr:DUF3108 domain-containing protein [Bacteroidales bacterium]HPS26312.1 DUF3108 domain-containing protein [Bacteroidales bacterium]